MVRYRRQCHLLHSPTHHVPRDSAHSLRTARGTSDSRSCTMMMTLPESTACNTPNFTADGPRNAPPAGAVCTVSMTSKLIFRGFRYIFLLFTTCSVIVDKLLLCQKSKHGTLFMPFTRIVIKGSRRELKFWSTIAVQSICPIPFSRPDCIAVT